ncbi:MAG: hypothetical protein AABZ75_05340 [candidate division NC10 bacterium]
MANALTMCAALFLPAGLAPQPARITRTQRVLAPPRPKPGLRAAGAATPRGRRR